MKQRFAVYDLIVDGVVVYVGMSKDPHKRFFWHKVRKKIPRHGTMRVVRWYTDKFRALDAEAARIAEKAPVGNVFHHPDVVAARRAAVQKRKDDAAKRKLDAEMERYARNWAFMHELEELLKQER